MVKKFNSGFIAIVGKPNVGKSTLLNTILKQKVAIVTNKPQTTRNKIQGIYTTDNEQIIFIDTPGINKTKKEFNRFLNKTAIQSTKDVEGILFLICSNKINDENDEYIFKTLKERKVPIFLILTKIDLISSDTLQQLIIKYQTWGFNKIIPISSKENININLLLLEINKIIPEGPQYFPSDLISDAPEQFLMKEIIREKILLLTEEEIPHSIAILIENYEYDPIKNISHLDAIIVTERDSQKKIIIGKGGKMIKSIGIAARIDLQQLLGNQFNLQLFVKVIKNWREKPSLLARMGYSKDKY